MKPYKPSEAVQWLEQDYDVTFASDACSIALININDIDEDLPPEYVYHYIYQRPQYVRDYTHIRAMCEVFPIHSACSHHWGCEESRPPVPWETEPW